MLFFKFNLPHLVRIYLPPFAVLLIFAGQGFATILDLAARRRQTWITWALGATLFAYLGASSWQTLFGPLDAPLAVRPIDIVEAQGLDPRWSSVPMLDALDGAGLAEEEWVGIHQSYEMMFRVLDRGYDARMFNPPVPGTWPEPLPRFVIGQCRNFEGAMNANFGPQHPYELVVRENVGRFGLYRLR